MEQDSQRPKAEVFDQIPVSGVCEEHDFGDGASRL